MSNLSKIDKQKIILAIRERGVKRDGCKAVNISIHELNDEIKLHKNFAKEVKEAVAEGNQNLADKGKEYIADVIDQKISKTDRNAITGAIAALNAYEPGFKGTSKVEGHINHLIEVKTGVPRPNYQIDVAKVDNKISNVDKDKLKALNSGKPITSIDDAVNNVVEGEIINE
jgi:hypothetical protein